MHSSHHYVTIGLLILVIFFFNDTATTEIYTLSLHDALPISRSSTGTDFPDSPAGPFSGPLVYTPFLSALEPQNPIRSEEHTSELQSQSNLVCRLLLEKKNIHHLPRRHLRAL